MAAVIEAARGLELLDEGGRLKHLDSLNVLDLVLELERLLKIEIPAPTIRMEHFASAESVCAWLEGLAPELSRTAE
jgi:acyl carrier protein